MRIVEWTSRLGFMTLFTDAQAIWTRLSGADESESVKVWAWATDPVFGFLEMTGGRGVPTVVSLRRAVLELGVTDGEHGWDVQDAFAPLLSRDEAVNATEWIAFHGVRPSPGLRARGRAGSGMPSGRPKIEEIVAAAIRADRLQYAA